MNSRKISVHFGSADWGAGPPGEDPTPGGANWVRIQTPARQLMAAGHEVAIGSSIAIQKRTNLMVALDHQDQPCGEAPEVVVLQRWMHKDAPRHIQRAREAGQVVINDVDDWFDGLDPANQAFLSSHPKTNPDINRNHYRKSLGASSMITTSTDYLAQRLAPLGAPIRVIHNSVRMQDFTVNVPSDAKDGLLVAWVGGVSWRSGDLETIAPWFGGWLREHDSRFIHHGVHSKQRVGAWTLLGLADDQVAGWRPMVPPHLYGKTLMTGFDVGLAPLADVPFNHAKSMIKPLEYSAAGIPFVGSKTAEYDGLGAGFTARRPRDWIRAMDRLLDPQVRLERHIVGLQAARRNDIGVRWVDWEGAYLDALSRR